MEMESSAQLDSKHKCLRLHPCLNQLCLRFNRELRLRVGHVRVRICKLVFTGKFGLVNWHTKIEKRRLVLGFTSRMKCLINDHPHVVPFYKHENGCYERLRLPIVCPKSNKTSSVCHPRKNNKIGCR